MINFDASQQRVLELDPGQHARVLGAPGSGKTLLLIEAFTRISAKSGWADDHLLVLAPTRRVAAKLRRQLELRLERAIGGTPVRTAASLAFAILQGHAAAHGAPAPRLLTGRAQDDVVEAVLTDVAQGRVALSKALPFAEEVLLTEAFRGELRELNRLIDDFALDPAEFASSLPASLKGVTSEQSTFFRDQWLPALELVEIVRARLAAEHPGELTASAMMRLACEMLRSDESIEVPRLVLVDDAAEVGEGALALLAALATRGAKVWVFGDPDTATGAFQGEPVRLMSALGAELDRRRALRVATRDEQLVVLERVHRHGAEIRETVSAFASRVGVSGAGKQREAVAVEVPSAHRGSEGNAVQFALAATAAEQLGMVAHRLRSRHLAVDGGEKVSWSQMAVVCRSRAEVKRASRLLASHQVPSSIAAGGIVLREHKIVREFVRLLQHALGLNPLNARDVSELLVGVVGGLDPISIRRLRNALRLSEVRLAKAEGRQATNADELIFEAFELAGDQAVLDMRAARRLRRLGKLAKDASAVHSEGGTPREVLWQLWHGSGLAAELEEQALDAKSAGSDEANRALDAVVGLFFTLQRHEEQDSDRPIELVLEELLTSTVAEDSLAARSEREVVTVTTPQGLVGEEFDVVCVLGLQDGSWPNLRSRGSLLGVTALGRYLRDGQASQPSRRDTTHDEMRLLVHAFARARRELLVVSVSNEDEHPSPFFALGREKLVPALPSSRLTMRGAVAQMRRRLVDNPADSEAIDSLVALASAGVPGAHPDEWYGVAQISTTDPLADIDAGEFVNVSPSQLEKAESCPLDWIVSRLGDSAGDYRVNIGTLIHHALELATPESTAQELLDVVLAQWGSLHFEAQWQSQRALEDATEMAAALAEYLQRFEHSRAALLATEAPFEVSIDFARLRGNADRIEATQTSEGGAEVTVVDLKTGRQTSSKSEIESHAQLLAYQLGVARGVFVDKNGDPIQGSSSAAKLLYVHPAALTKSQQARGERYVEIEQAGLSEADRVAFEQRVLEIARVMAGAEFTAQVEHHCDVSHGPAKACALHIIPAVSHA